MQPFSHFISLRAVHQSAVCRRAHQPLHPVLHRAARARRCPSATKGAERRSGTETLPCSHWEARKNHQSELAYLLHCSISFPVLFCTLHGFIYFIFFFKRPEIPCQHLASVWLSSSLPIQNPHVKASTAGRRHCTVAACALPAQTSQHRPLRAACPVCSQPTDPLPGALWQHISVIYNFGAA